MDKGYNLEEFKSLHDITFRDLRTWGVKGWIEYGVKLYFFEDVQDGFNTLKDRDNLISWLEENERYEDLAWLMVEINKFEKTLINK
jgi:hypothetical protein